MTIDDGRGKREVSYNRAGYPTEVKDAFGNVTKVCYNTFNVPVKVIDANGIVTEYKYSDAGLVTSVTRKDGAETLASVSVAYDKNRHTNTFTWDGLALIQRGDEHFLNEPHVGGGNPVASSKGTSYFNDMLGTTVGAKSGAKYSAETLSAFGEDLTVNAVGDSSHSPFPVPHSPFFTGKPYVEGLGHAFWMRNYRAGLAKWQTADSMGYPDGWNQLSYCGNGVTRNVDLWGGLTVYVWDSSEDGWGHAAIELNNGTYISWWPDNDRDGKQKGEGPLTNIYDAPHIPDRTFDDAKAGEDNRDPWCKKIDGLDEDSIQKWWDEFSKDDDNQWSTFSQNCSTVAAEALKQGGASTEWWDLWNGWNVVWTPEDVRRFAEAIAE